MKRVKIFVFVLVGIFFFSITVNAAENDEYAELEADYYNMLMDELTDETLEVLTESGIDKIDFESIISAEPADIIKFFKNTATGTISGPIKNFALNCVVSVALSVAFSYLNENEKKKKAVNLLSYAYIALSICIPMASLLSAGAAAIKLSSKFMMVFLPVLAGIIAAARNPVLALNYNSVTLYLAHAISTFSSNILLPFEGMLFALVSVNMVSDTMNVKNLSNTIKNGVTKTLSVLATIFVAFLSVKGILSNIADSVALKGAKLLVSNLVPVIGGSMSEAYATVVNSLSLLKSSVGVFGIVCIAAINLPVIFELCFWGISLACSALVADAFGIKSIADYFREISNVVKTFNVILIFSCVLFIISTGILLVLKNSI